MLFRVLSFHGLGIVSGIFVGIILAVPLFQIQVWNELQNLLNALFPFRVMASKIKMAFVNRATAANSDVQFVLYPDHTTLDPSDGYEERQRYAKTIILSQPTVRVGMLRHFAKTKVIEGYNPKLEADYAGTLNYDGTLLSRPSREWFWRFFIRKPYSTAAAASIFIKLKMTLYVEFFEPRQI